MFSCSEDTSLFAWMTTTVKTNTIWTRAEVLGEEFSWRTAYQLAHGQSLNYTRICSWLTISPGRIISSHTSSARCLLGYLTSLHHYCLPECGCSHSMGFCCSKLFYSRKVDCSLFGGPPLKPGEWNVGTILCKYIYRAIKYGILLEWWCVIY